MKRLLWILPALLLLLLLPYTPLGKPLIEKRLGEKIGGKVTIETARLSWLGPQKFQNLQFQTPDFSGQIGELAISSPLWALSKAKDASIQNGTFATIENIQGQIAGHQVNLTGVSETGKISIVGTIAAKDEFDLAFDLTSFPVPNRYARALGATVDLSGSANLNKKAGSANIRLSSPNIQTALHANLSENSITLQQPLHAQLLLTPEMSQELLSEINPLFLTGVVAKNPINLTIDSNGFFFPLPFSIDKFQAAGSLDVGQILCKTGKSLRSILSLLKAGAGETMDAWFTPLTFQFQNGNVATGRMDALLADTIHICTWGRINLVQDKLHMYLGLPADTLNQSFGIQGLSSKYVMKIPIRGSTKDPEIETGPAAAKITAMIASQQLLLKKKTPIGGLINSFATIKEDKSVPPANRPFPWEKGL